MLAQRSAQTGDVGDASAPSLQEAVDGFTDAGGTLTLLSAFGVDPLLDRADLINLLNSLSRSNFKLITRMCYNFCDPILPSFYLHYALHDRYSTEGEDSCTLSGRVRDIIITHMVPHPFTQNNYQIKGKCPGIHKCHYASECCWSATGWAVWLSE